MLGKGELAIRVCEWFLNSPGYELSYVVPVAPEPLWTTSLASWAADHAVPFVASGDYRHLEINPDLAVSVFYDKIFKRSFIESCGKIINLHNSPLPKYRGVSPINWALKNEELEHGVTLHQITPGIDDGPIFGQLKYSIYPEIDEVCDVYKRALEYGYTLFEQTMPILDKISVRAQNENDATYYNASENKFLGERRYFTKKETEARKT